MCFFSHSFSQCNIGGELLDSECIRHVFVVLLYDKYTCQCCWCADIITGYGSTLYIGIAMVFVFSPYI